ncbi:MAG TPA: HipA domain-containing protein [Balneolales bacterium]|nr:HipA domain-containing protein [Balneolales bacterium]
MSDRCPITYKKVIFGLYSDTGLHKLNPALNGLNLLPFDRFGLHLEVQKQYCKISIPGTQPKLNAQLSVKDETFKLSGKSGSFILKPDSIQETELPQNEDVTMRMAKEAGIEIPIHGLVYDNDHSLVYVTKRFDRVGKTGKIQTEDFAGIIGVNRLSKTDGSLEQIAGVIDKYCTFPVVEKMKLYRRILFGFLTGNANMHLKKFSIINKKGKITLSPAYGLRNTIIMPKKIEQESALTLNGQLSGFNNELLSNYFGREILGLNEKVLINIEQKMVKAYPEWKRLVNICFLSEEKKKAYLEVMKQRWKVLGWLV